MEEILENEKRFIANYLSPLGDKEQNLIQKPRTHPAENQKIEPRLNPAMKKSFSQPLTTFLSKSSQRNEESHGKPFSKNVKPLTHNSSFQKETSEKGKILLGSLREGMVKFFDDQSGCGFIIDDETKRDVFTHYSGFSAGLFDLVSAKE